MWLFFLNFFIWWTILMAFCILHHPRIPGMKTTWLQWIIVLMCFWIWFARILLSIFASIFISEIGLKFSFFVVCLCGLGIRVTVALWNELSSFPSASTLWCFNPTQKGEQSNHGRQREGGNWGGGRGKEERKGMQDQVWGRQKRSPECQENEWGWIESLVSPRDLGWGRLPGVNADDLRQDV